MAHGIACLHCGREEGAHEELSMFLEKAVDRSTPPSGIAKSVFDESTIVWDGYRVSLRDCLGYEPDNPHLHGRIAG